MPAGGNQWVLTLAVRRSWALIEKISPKAAEILQEADDLKSMKIDFTDIFVVDTCNTQKLNCPELDQR